MIGNNKEILKGMIKDAEWRIGSYIVSNYEGNDTYILNQINKIKEYTDELSREE